MPRNVKPLYSVDTNIGVFVCFAQALDRKSISLFRSVTDESLTPLGLANELDLEGLSNFSSASVSFQNPSTEKDQARNHN